MNIRPLMKAQLRIGGKKGAGILRSKPNVKWGPKPDRGKETVENRPEAEFPWFWGCSGGDSELDRTDYTAERASGSDFDGNRWNNLHYSRLAKETARNVAEARDNDSAES